MLILELCVRVFIPFVLIITFNVATVVSLCKNKMQSNSANRRAHVQVFTKLTVLTGITFTIANSADAVFAVTRIFSLPVDVKFVLNHREEFLYLNNVMNPIICFVVCKSARDDTKTFLLMIATRLRFTRVCRTRSQQGSSIATVETGTGHRANNGHELAVKKTTESKGNANVESESDKTNKDTNTGAVMNEGSNTGDKSKKRKTTVVTTNEGSKSCSKANHGSDKCATTNKGSKSCSKANQGSDKDATTNEGSQPGLKSIQGSDKDAISTEISHADDTNVNAESDKSASAREASDRVARTKAGSDTGAKASEAPYTEAH